MKKSSEIRILFIGNSYTYYNNLPGLLEYFARSSGVGNLRTKMVVRGGANLKLHLNSGKAFQEMRRNKYDYVVLQEQSRLGGGYKNGVYKIGDPEKFFESSRRFNAEIKKAGAKTVFFLTWAAVGMKDGQPKLTAAYSSISKELKAILAPAGKAWKKALKERPGIPLFQEDGGHPSPLGTYLVACVFYKTLFKKSPIGLPFRTYDSKSQIIPAGLKMINLNPKDARFLQKMASE